MAYRRVPYESSRNFVRAQDFLAATIPRLGILFTWDISRWNYARYSMVPHCGGDEGIRAWEERIGLWETPCTCRSPTT